MVKLSQVFLKRSIAQKEASYANSKDVVLEIGTGKLNLTYFLCKRAKYVVSIEKDKDLFLISTLNAQKLGLKNLEIWNKDFLELDKKDYAKLNEMNANKIISNPPYHISSPLLIKIKEVFDSTKINEAYLTLQKEFVEHITATHGSKYSRISVFANLNFEIKPIFEVKNFEFYPKPKVDSVFVLIKPKNAAYGMEKEENEVINRIMQQKKKTLYKALKINFGKDLSDSLAKKIGKDLIKKRVFEIEPSEMLQISKVILKEIEKNRNENENNK